MECLQGEVLSWSDHLISYMEIILIMVVVVVRSLSYIWLFATQWTAAHHASLSFSISWSLLTLTAIKLVMPSNHLIICHPLLLLPSIFPSIRVFVNKSALHIRWPKYWSFSISPSNEYQDWFPLGLAGLISLLSKGLSRLFSNTTLKSINSSVLSLIYGPDLTSIHDYWKNHTFDQMDFCRQTHVFAF